MSIGGKGIGVPQGPAQCAVWFEKYKLLFVERTENDIRACRSCMCPSYFKSSILHEHLYSMDQFAPEEA